ncbi:MAG TPA: sigma-54 dependent transcriptional regulator, partial [Polyangiaceae bacterium]|nr:sigma-54 dependent transcriptional regulator [Polyangiaceae bacterium]
RGQGARVTAPAPSSRVLIVEDQPAVATALRLLLEVHDVPALTAATPARALEVVDQEELGLVIQDMNFSPGDTSGREGLALFRRIRELDPGLPVLALTAWTSLEAAVEMVKAGAADYLAKPWDDAKLMATVRNLLRLRELALENERLKREGARARDELARRYDLRGLVYESPAMHRAVALAGQVAPADVPVLITGPNGAGKEMFAEIVQANSRRRSGPFVKVNAGALPDELLEVELFGAEPGAYTGASKRRVGRFEAAHGGTLFLDEIGNLSPAGQMKLLRVLQRGEFERVGSSQTRKVDVRLLAATNADLRAAIAAGRFREDLFFRLNVIEIEVPPLRDRPEDVLPLADALLARVAPPSGAKALSAAARAALQEHPWPGNVRELMNRIQRAMLVAAGPEIGPEDLGLAPADVAPGRAEPADPAHGRAEPADLAPGRAEPLDEAAREERRRLEHLLQSCDGMISRAAAELNVSRQALYRRMQRLGIVLERRPKT